MHSHKTRLSEDTNMYDRENDFPFLVIDFNCKVNIWLSKHQKSANKVKDQASSLHGSWLTSKTFEQYKFIQVAISICEGIFFSPSQLFLTLLLRLVINDPTRAQSWFIKPPVQSRTTIYGKLFLLFPCLTLTLSLSRSNTHTLSL